jgi:hypothetical protein
MGKFPKFHGIELASGAEIRNLVIENVAGVDEAAVISTAGLGKAWFSVADDKYKFTTAAGVISYATEQQLLDAIAAINSGSDATTVIQTELDNTQTGAGLASDGSYVAPVESNYLAATTSIKDALLTLDTELGDVQTELETTVSEAISTEVSAREAADADLDTRVVALETYTETLYLQSATDPVLDVAYTDKIKLGDEWLDTTDGTLYKRISDGESEYWYDIVGNISSSLISTEVLSKTTLDPQTVAGSVTFSSELTAAGDFRITGRLIQEGEALNIVGENVLFEDNKIYLNSNADPLIAPTEDAGWGVNRGNLGETDIVVWKEADKSTTVYTTSTIKGYYSLVDEAADQTGVIKAGTYNGVDTVVEEIGKITTFNEFQNEVTRLSIKDDANYARLVGLINTKVSDLTDADTALDTRITTLESSVSGNTGDLELLTTEVKTDLVSAVNEVDANVDALDTRVTTVEGQVNGNIGTLTELTTDVKTDLVSAINEVDSNIDALSTSFATSNATVELTKTMVYVSTVAATTHTIDVSSFATDMLDVSVWISEDGKWVNSIVAVTIDPVAETVTIDLTEALNVRATIRRSEIN